ncbi:MULTISPECIES: response regulator transcription factor [Pseudomonas]|uniref:response regulator transcription factor n=1 Tax=Pseudomonas TaxID=286 RepID=UPI0002A3F2A8|nr:MULTISPECIES: response regulator [Pseudomonas]MBB1604903.1 two-component system response regulator [Pseudomonas sp. UMC76]MBB1641852.1 two-component system response regulator [Pseudomonas sp. UME83]NTX90352.1 response regulator [Pseudomonas sp. UMA643]NTY21640.1 response regulator [Pseudomonas sp. UMC3103]NTY27831.1 response regulator [Pseudomonas sp. UMA603]
MTQEPPSRQTAVIAVVDDDESVRAALQSLLRASGYRVRNYSSALDFLAAAPGEAQCLVSDVQMPGMSGLQLHARLIAMGLRIPVIFITAYPEAVPAPLACLPKPFDAERLLACIETALRQPR